MANFKRASSTAIGTQRTVLGALQEAKIVDSKPILPAGLLFPLGCNFEQS